jgi:hypothetical protein
MEITLPFPGHLTESFVETMLDEPAEDGTRQSRMPIANGKNSEGFVLWTHWKMLKQEGSILTLDIPNLNSFLQQLIQFFVKSIYQFSEERYHKGYKEGQERQYTQKTDMEKFVSMVANVNEYELPALAKENEFIIHDLLHDLPGTIRKLDELLSKAKTVLPFEGVIKPYKIAPDEEIIFFYERRLERKSRRMIIGLNEQKQRISLEYAWLYNCSWIDGKQYVIKNLGLVEGRRRRDPSYYAFEVKEAEQLLN